MTIIYRTPIHCSAKASLDMVVLNFDDAERIEFWVYAGRMGDANAVATGADKTVRRFDKFTEACRDFAMINN